MELENALAAEPPPPPTRSPPPLGMEVVYSESQASSVAGVSSVSEALLLMSCWFGSAGLPVELVLCVLSRRLRLSSSLEMVLLLLRASLDPDSVLGQTLRTSSWLCTARLLWWLVRTRPAFAALPLRISLFEVS